MNKKPTYSEFSDPRLVAIYDTINPIASYEGFYLELATKLVASSIIDFGCGSGLLTCALAKKGHHMIGVDPSGRMLELARQRCDGKHVLWIEGGTQQLGNIQADLVIMTGHVAQFFLEDENWLETLKVFHKALKPGGHIAFESRNPLILPFATWPTEESHQKLNDPKAGQVEWWVKFLDTNGEKVRYDIHYLFTKSGEVIVSTNELRFWTQKELIKSLTDVGFSVENIYGDWDSKPKSAESPEMIFIAKRRIP